MEPVSLIVAALAAGAAAGVKPTAEQAVKDAYAGLKKLITDRYRRVNLDMLEEMPESEAQREAVGQLLARERAMEVRERSEAAEDGERLEAEDRKLIEAAERVAKVVEAHAPEVARDIGLRIDEVTKGLVRVKEVTVRGGTGADRGKTGVDVGTVSGGELRVGPINMGP
jgi:hypothetical protein